MGNVMTNHTDLIARLRADVKKILHAPIFSNQQECRIMEAFSTALEALARENAELREAAKWRPQATAPTDGTWFLGIDTYNFQNSVRWSDNWFEDAFGGAFSLMWWQPLPAPPDEETDDGG